MARVLLVEDTPEVWDLLSRRLTRRGHAVSLAHDGQAGIDKARAERPEIILLDMNMPVMDGWTAARALKADDATRAIPIIALTAHALASDREKALAMGCDDYHPKPVDFSRLLEQIDAAIAGAPTA
jgi:CheY-like chemotaxis protein